MNSGEGIQTRQVRSGVRELGRRTPKEAGERGVHLHVSLGRILRTVRQMKHRVVRDRAAENTRTLDKVDVEAVSVFRQSNAKTTADSQSIESPLTRLVL